MTEAELAEMMAADKWFDSRGHVWILYSIARALARSFQIKGVDITALEIGVREASTTIPLLAGLTAGNPNARLVSLDNDTDLDRDALTRGIARVEAAGLAHAWEFHKTDSHTWTPTRDAFHLLHIDGDHSYVGVKTDFERYTPLLARHGLVTLHDSETYPDVRKYVHDELYGGAWDVVTLPFYNGLAIARAKADRAETFTYKEDGVW